MLTDLAFINKSTDNTLKIWKERHDRIKANHGNLHEFLLWIEYIYGTQAKNQFDEYLVLNR